MRRFRKTSGAVIGVVAVAFWAWVGCDTGQGAAAGGDAAGRDGGRRTSVADASSTAADGPGTDVAVGQDTAGTPDEGAAGDSSCGCPEGLECNGQDCVAPNGCTPDAALGCQNGMLLLCDQDGTSVRSALCPAGEGCVGGDCQPISPNVLLLVDTSSSMNWTPAGTQPDQCGSSCWPWSYPSCDSDGAGPRTRLGRVKEALNALLASDSAAGLSIALQRFPQTIYTALPPSCEGGYWTGNSALQGDEGFHALSRAFLAQHLPEIVVFPFQTEGETDRTGLARWFDGTETLAETATTCLDNAGCSYTPCLSGHCQAFSNPELWGMGLTPLGQSLFYAGEYFRNFVVVEGRSCDTTADCGSAHYDCIQGACHDPFRSCRPNVIIAFTDGEETEHFYTDDFFHPRVQAKRLHYGLGCDSQADCGGGATCEAGVCRPPARLIDEAQLVCDDNDVPCQASTDCPARRCIPARLDLVDPAGEDHLVDPSGHFISLTVNVVDASDVPGANRLIAAYGGGQHFSVDLDDPEAILATFQTLFGDAKQSFEACLGE